MFKSHHPARPTTQLTARLTALAITSITTALTTPTLAASLQPEAPIPTPNQTTSPTTQTTTTTTLYSGSLWTKAKANIEGSYHIEQDAQGHTIVFSKDFKTKQAPLDLRIVLSPHTAPKHAKAPNTQVATGKNALQGGVIVANLTSIEGAQRYRIPASIDLSKYRSVLLHCEEYKVLWGGAPLAKGDVIARGDTWQKKAKKVTGHYEIAQDDKGYILRLGPDFRTSKGPDLKPVLSPTPAASVKGDTAQRGSLTLSLLSSNKGYQEFRIPAGTDLTAYRSLLIHCEQYTKLWAATPLTLNP